MNKIINKKAFTLMEVVISLAIFSILSVGFYSLFSAVFINSYKTSKITEKAFLSQREIEDKVANIKHLIDTNKSGNITENMEEITLFSEITGKSRTVNGYLVKNDDASLYYLETFVAQTRPPKATVPILSPFNITGFDGANNQILNPNMGINNLKLGINGKLEVENPGYLKQYVYKWYVSDEIGYTAHETPVFPDKYQMIIEATSSSLQNVNNEIFSGKYFYQVITPVSLEGGQMGETIISNPLLISKFKKNNNLLLRLDASYLNVNSTDEIESRLNSIDGYYYSYIKRMSTVYPDISSTPPKTDDNKQAVMDRVDVTRDDEDHTVFLITGVDENVKEITTASANSINSKSSITVYLTLIYDSSLGEEVNIIQAGSKSGNNRWWLKANGNTLTLSRQFTNTNTRSIDIPIDFSIADGIQFIKLEVSNSNLLIEINGGQPKQTTYSLSGTFNTTPMTIGVNDKISIGDILVYDGKHTNSDRDELYEYFTEKYKP